MSRVDNVNEFYGNFYEKMGLFARAPYNWKVHAHDMSGAGYVLNNVYKAILSPVLLPATVVTFTLAAISSLLAAVTQTLALLVAATADFISPEKDLAVASLNL